MPHLMSSPKVRWPVAGMIACVIGVCSVAVTILGRPSGAFTDRELPDVAGLPILVPQIERLVPPKTGDLGGVPSLVPDPGATP